MLKISKHKRPKKKKEKRISSSDDDDVPFFGGLLGNLALGALSASASNRKASKMRRTALADAQYQSPEEIEYANKLRRRSQYGMDNFQQRRNLAIQPIIAQADRTRTRAGGQAIRQGLENSIIAQEMRNRIDADAQTQIRELSERLALANEEFKRQNESALDSYNLQRANRIRGITSQANQNYAMNKINASDILTNFAQSFLTGFQKSEAGSKILEQGFEDFGNFLAGDFKIG